MSTLKLPGLRQTKRDPRRELATLQLDMLVMWDEIEARENPRNPADMPSEMVIDRAWREYRELEKEERRLLAEVVALNGTLRRKGY